MFTCAECTDRMKPDDPRMRSGRYHMCGCDYCSKPTYYRELEDNKQPREQIVLHRHADMGKKEFDLLQQTAAEVKNLRDKVIELQKRKPGINVKSTYKGIK